MASSWGGSWGSSWGTSWGSVSPDAPQVEYARSGYWPCQRCGIEYPERSLLREWTGLRVCTHCFDARHPQEAVRGVFDRQGIRPDMRPEPADVFLQVGDVTADDL